MPLFSSNKFLPKKIPPRKISTNFPKVAGNGQDEEMRLDVEKIHLQIGDQLTVFEDGDWIPGILHNILLNVLEICYIETKYILVSQILD